MKTASEIKRFFKEKFNIPVRVSTGTGKSKWQTVWIRSNPCKDHREPFTYDHSFPLQFRIDCLKLIYPNSPGCHSGSAGNVGQFSIAMVAPQWEEIIKIQNTPKA